MCSIFCCVLKPVLSRSILSHLYLNFAPKIKISWNLNPQNIFQNSHQIILRKSSKQKQARAKISIWKITWKWEVGWFLRKKIAESSWLVDAPNCTNSARKAHENIPRQKTKIKEGKNGSTLWWWWRFLSRTSACNATTWTWRLPSTPRYDFFCLKNWSMLKIMVWFGFGLSNSYRLNQFWASFYRLIENFKFFRKVFKSKLLSCIRLFWN